jgi:ribonuclease P protein component
MLPRAQRVPGYRIAPVLAGKTIFSEAGLLIKAAPNNLEYSRLSVVVSGKFLNLATQRNRLRRQLVAVIDPDKISPGFDVVVLVRKAR